MTIHATNHILSQRARCGVRVGEMSTNPAHVTCPICVRYVRTEEGVMPLTCPHTYVDTLSRCQACEIPVKKVGDRYVPREYDPQKHARDAALSRAVYGACRSCGNSFVHAHDCPTGLCRVSEQDR